MKISKLILLLFLTIGLAIQIIPKNTAIYNGLLIKNITISPNNYILLKNTINDLKCKGKYYEVYLLNDLAQLLGVGFFKDINVIVKKNSDNSVDVNFNLIENPAIKTIELNKFSLIDKKKITDTLANKVGVPINYAVITNDIKTIEKYYHDKGYLLAKVTNVFFIKHLQSLIFNIEEGIIDEIIIEGTTSIEKNLVLRELSSKSGSIFNTNTLKKDREKILKLAFFSQVSMPKIVPSNKNPGKINVVYNLKERKINNLNVGLQQLQNNAIGLNLGLRFPNFRNTGEGISFKGKTIVLSQLNYYSYHLHYWEPWIMGNNLPFNATTWYQKNKEKLYTSKQYDVIRKGYGFNIAPSLIENIKMVFSYQYEDVAEETRKIPEYNKRSLKFSAIYNNVENLFNPLSGKSAFFELEKAGDLGIIKLQGIKYTKVLFKGSYFYNLINNDVFAVHTDAGWLIYKNNKLFEQDKFIIGGAYSLRGYPDYYTNSFEAIMGNKKLLINMEYRMNINNWLQGVLFVDWGNAYSGSLNFAEFKIGKGVGVRIFTPLAPLRFDLATGKTGDVIIHFGLGQLF